MVEEKRKSFAEMFKKKPPEGSDSSDGSSSVLDKFGIKKKTYPATSSPLAKKSAPQEEEDRASESDAESEDGHASDAGSADAISKIIARKKVASANSFTQNVEYGRSDLVFLVRGKDRGREAWHYVYVDKMKKAMFLAAAKSGSLDVADYGKVLFSGWGKDPPEDIVQKVKVMFNIT